MLAPTRSVIPGPSENDGLIMMLSLAALPLPCQKAPARSRRCSLDQALPAGGRVDGEQRESTHGRRPHVEAFPRGGER
jgi:hypothetical protein